MAEVTPLIKPSKVQHPSLPKHTIRIQNIFQTLTQGGLPRFLCAAIWGQRFTISCQRKSSGLFFELQEAFPVHQLDTRRNISDCAEYTYSSSCTNINHWIWWGHLRSEWMQSYTHYLTLCPFPQGGVSSRLMVRSTLLSLAFLPRFHPSWPLERLASLRCRLTTQVNLFYYC